VVRVSWIIRVSTRLFVRVSYSSIPYSYQLHICTYTILKFHGIIIYPCPQLINAYNNYAPSDIRMQMQGLSSSTGNMERKDTLRTLCTYRPHCNPVAPWQLNARILPQALFEIQFNDSDTECWSTDARWVSAAINSKPVVFASARVELDRCIRFAPLTSYTCACNIPNAPLPAFLLLSYRLSCSVSKLLKVFEFCDALKLVRVPVARRPGWPPEFGKFLKP
jgi:hypothetical protein